MCFSIFVCQKVCSVVWPSVWPSQLHFLFLMFKWLSYFIVYNFSCVLYLSQFHAVISFGSFCALITDRDWAHWSFGRPSWHKMYTSDNGSLGERLFWGFRLKLQSSHVLACTNNVHKQNSSFQNVPFLFSMYSLNNYISTYVYFLSTDTYLTFLLLKSYFPRPLWFVNELTQMFRVLYNVPYCLTCIRRLTHRGNTSIVCPSSWNTSVCWTGDMHSL